uniref:Germin-like protein n=1 Tax=Rhizophora mucronata TaxID=61149 RepID=A0A2P2N5H4_RHIMU
MSKDFMRITRSFLHLLLLLSFQILALLLGLTKPDPDPLQDYCVADTKAPQSVYLNGAPCINPKQVVSSHFTTSVLSKPGNTSANLFGFNVTLTNIANLPGLNTMGLTMARIDLAVDGLLPPHWHPRASEVTICLKGSLLVGFVDTSNRLFTQDLQVGDSFVFPKGMIHFLYNNDPQAPALAVSGLNCQNPGVQLASLATFTARPYIPDEVLSKAFQITDREIRRIRRNLGG